MQRPLLKSLIAGGLFATSIVVSSPVDAQTSLVAKDGNITIEGKLKGFDDTNYTIETDLGELIVHRDFVDCLGEGCPESATDVANSTAIELSSPDGSIRLIGELIELTQTDYVILTTTGELTVRRELVVCEGASCPSTTEVTSQEELTIVGPADVGVTVLRTVVQRYSEAKNLNVTTSAASSDSSDLLVGTTSGIEVAKVTAQGKNANDAINAVLDGTASFALVRERVTPKTLSAFLGRPVDEVEEMLRERTIALDALSFVAHTANPIDSLAIDDIKAILGGQISSWADLGGPTGDIIIHSLPLDSELMSQMSAMLYGDEQSASQGNYVFHSSIDELRDAIAADPLGFGVVFRSRQGNLVPMELASSCSIHYGSSDFSIQTQEYPFSVSWYLYSKKNADLPDFARSLMSFLPTNEGQDALSSLGLLSQGLRSEPMKDQGSRVLTGVLANSNGSRGGNVLAKYLEQVAESKRLSTSLRFTSGSTTPDSKAQEDIDRISAMVRKPEFANYVVKLVGFSDSVGAFDRNISISQTRAAQIRDLLLADNPGWLRPEDVQILGAGPLAPVECNDTDKGRRLNRRVEVWLAPPQ